MLLFDFLTFVLTTLLTSLLSLHLAEIVWEIASQLRIDSTKFPVPDALSLPAGRQDSRRIMATVYRLFKGGATEQDLAMAGLMDKQQSSKPSDEFYALFYLALYNEARSVDDKVDGHENKASHYMRQALQTQYAKANGLGNPERSDYMVAVARVSSDAQYWFSPGLKSGLLVRRDCHADSHLYYRH